VAWNPSNITKQSLLALVGGGLLSKRSGRKTPEWIVPPSVHRESSPPEGYVVSFMRLHEWGFNAPTGRFLQDLCRHYTAELHNFAPNAISQVASFVAVYEGFLGIEVH
jgi:hypothetical protein